MLPLAPITVTGQVQTIKLPFQSLGWRWIVLANQSQFALQPQIGNYLGRWLPPLTADIYPVPKSASQLTLTPTTLGVPSTVSPTVLATLYDEVDQVPNTGYPHQMVVQALSALFGSNGDPVFDISAFGAVSGAGDNTAPITSALAAIPASGGTLFFPPGVWNTSSTAFNGL